MRGKDFYKRNPLRYVSGSPPRAREGREIKYFSKRRLGITPACAGRTRMNLPVENKDEDHPRVRGKDATDQVKQFGMAGSPPRAREGLDLKVQHCPD